MGYRGYRRRNYRSYPPSPPSKEQRLSSKIGRSALLGIAKEDFFSLSESNLEALFIRYGNQYGKSAAGYARKTYPKWKSGQTKTSGQTIERLLDLVPRYLSTGRRLELLKEILKHNNRNNRTNVTIKIDVADPSVGFDQLNAALTRFDPSNKSTDIPDSVLDVAKWISDDDVTVARSIWHQASNVEYEQIAYDAKRTVENIHAEVNRSINVEGSFTSAMHDIYFPDGYISVSVMKSIPHRASKHKGNSECFIATEVYGSSMHRDVSYLRSVRDNYFLKSSFGCTFVVAYYRVSPKIACFLRSRTVAKFILRYLLSIFVSILRAIYR